MASTLSASYEGSNRFIHADGDFGLLQNWAKLDNASAFESDPFFDEIMHALNFALPVSDSFIDVFRGRDMRGCTPTSAEMGPPPVKSAIAGRYNTAGNPVLYCSSSEDGVKRELNEPNVELWCQKFRIDVAVCRIADFRVSAYPEKHIFNNLFWFAELAGAEGYPSQVLSRFVANLVSQKFDGMLVPGIQGDVTVQYQNLILFNPLRHWQQYLLPIPPYRLLD
jgi:RES domain-containing protein